jgi:hypothetical protein
MLAIHKIDPGPVTVPAEEVIFHPHSFADDAGRLFQWNGQLFRGISYAHTAFFGRLFREQIVHGLIERGLLIETEETDLSVDGYEMVVSHRRIPFVSYPNEWCAAMLRDAAVTIIDLAIELTQQGLTLKDAHPWNVLFDSSRPVYVDLTSIAPQENEPTWSAYDEFCRFCYYPLILMSHGQERIARSLLPEYKGVLRAEVLTVVRSSGPSKLIFSKVLRRGVRSIQSIFKNNSSQSKLAFLRQAKGDLEKIKLPSYERSHWRRRNESMLAASTGPRETARPLTLRKILTELRPDTVLDLSRGAVWTSTLPAIMGFNVVSVDADAARVTSLYETAREKNLPILPLIVDFIKPTPSVGYSNHYSIAAVDRLKSDMVLAFGLADEIASDNHFSFDLIAEGLSSFSKRWLVVEFDDRKVEETNRRGGPNSESGGLNSFTEALLKHFRSVSVVSSEARAGTMLLCEK